MQIRGNFKLSGDCVDAEIYLHADLWDLQAALHHLHADLCEILAGSLRNTCVSYIRARCCENVHTR